MKRREFLKTAALSTAALAGIRYLPGAEQAERQQAAGSTNAPALLKRAYKDDVNFSIIGFGALMLRDMDPKDVARLVAESVEKGVNYFDVAPAYGKAEELLGPALEPYRKNVFLACKTMKRTRETAEADFNRSLERLKTDRFDLYQLHNLYDVEKDVEAAFRKGGAMEFILEQQKAGRIRYIGFSAHSVAAALRAMELHKFDSILFPFNFASIIKSDFGPQVLAKAQEIGAARMAIKALVLQKQQGSDDPLARKYRTWYQPLEDPKQQSLGLRFSLGLPITAAVPPMNAALYRRALEIAMQYKPLAPEEEAQVKELAMKVDPLFPREG